MKVLRTVESVIQYIHENFQDTIHPNHTVLETFAWICCLHEATMLQASTQKEVAEVIMHGIPGYKQNLHECCQNWLNDVYDDLNYAVEVGEVVIGDDNIISSEDVSAYAVLDVCGLISDHFSG